MNRAVFLDRDGVINHNKVRDGRPHGPETLEAFVILPGVREAINELRAAKFLVIVATNQPAIAPALTEAMHAIMRKTLALDDIRICPHGANENCACRKPKPGLLLDAARDYDITLKESWMVGDRWRDVEAGRAAGCRTVFIDHGYSGEPPPHEPDVTVRSLGEAVPYILGKK